MDSMFFNQGTQQSRQLHGVVSDASGAVKDATGIVKDVLSTVKKLFDGLKRLVGKKTDDQALLAVRNALDDVLHANGYSRPDRGGIQSAPSFTAFKLKDDQVSGKSPDYKYAYERLQNFLVAMFNAYKPGLGNQYKTANPVIMKNSKEVSDKWIENALAVIISNPVNSSATTPGVPGSEPTQAGMGSAGILIGLAAVGTMIYLGSQSGKKKQAAS